MSTECKLESQALVDDNGRTSQLIDEVEVEAARRAELDPARTLADHRVDVIDELIAMETRRADRLLIQINHSLKARERAIDNFRSFIEVGGLRRDVSVSRTVEALGNRVISEARRFGDQFDQALVDARLDGYFAQLRKNKGEAAKVLTEIGELNKTSGGTPGVSGSPNAKATAEIYQNFLNAMRARQAEIGIKSDDLEGFMIKQIWTRENLRLFGSQQAFVKEMLPRINRRKVFGKRGASDKRVAEFLGKFYTARTSGDLKDVPLDGRAMTSEKATYAARQLDHREIHLNTVEDTLFVMETFGMGDLPGALGNSISRVARKTIVSEVFGINPRNTVEHLRRAALREASDKEARNLDPTPTLGFSLKHGAPEAMMNVIDGGFDFSGNPNVALFSRAAGNFARMALLQRVLTSSFPDVATVGRANARIGGEVAANVSERANIVMRNLDPKTKRIVGAAVGDANAYNVGALRDRVASTSALGTFANTSIKASNFVMKYGGNLMWTRHNKQVAYVLGSSTLARLAGRKFSGLDQGVKMMLLRGGVTETDWNRLATLKDVAVYKVGSRRQLDVEALAGVDRELSSRLSAAITAFTDDAVPTPGVRERAIMTQGEDTGTITGAMLRAMTMLLSYPVTYMTRQMGREMELGGARGMAGMAYLTAASTFMGYVALMSKDLAANQTRDYFTDDLDQQRDMFLRAWVLGGGGGLVGSAAADLLSGGRPVSSTMGMPALDVTERTVFNSIKSVGKFIDGDHEGAAAGLIKAWRPIIPGSNFPHTEAAITLLFIEPLMDMVAPNELRKQEQRMRNRGVERIIPPIN